MGLSSELISQFVKITKDKETSKSESTAYGTVVKYNNKTYVKLDGSELLTPVTTTTDVEENERVTVTIKDHTATVMGNLSSPSARTDTVKEIDNEVTVLSNQITEFGIVIADKVSTTELDAERGRIDILVSDNVTINEKLVAAEADIDTLEANKASITELNVEKSRIDDLETDKASIKELNVEKGRIDILEANTVSITELNAEKARIDTLEANTVNITELNAEKARIDTLEATMITSDHAVIKNLQSDVADIDTLIFGSASGSTIQTSFANAVIAQLGNAQIKSAMIEDISASKIKAGNIITNNVQVMSEDGNLIISDETLQISDGARVRVQIGKDASNDYSINIWDAGGNLMFSKGGITDAAIKDAIIRNDMVATNANISASKLDIDSLFEEINGSTKTIKSTKVYLDETGQTLDLAFTKITSDVEGVQGTVTTHGTDITALNGAITGKIWQQDINTTIDKLEIGGRNYVLNSDVERSGVYSGIINYKLDKEKVAELVGHDLVISAYVKNTDNAKFDMYIRDSSGNNVRASGFGIPHQTTSEYTRFVNKFTLTSVSNLTANTWYIGIRSNTNVDPANTGTTSVKMVKLEVGTNVTDWTPAPEDVKDEISTLDTKYTEVKQTVDGLSTTVANHTTQIANKADGSEVTTVTDRVATLEGSLDGFKTTVSNTYTTKTDFNNLQIGGRNLLPNSSRMYAFSCASGLSASRPGDEYFQVISSSDNDNWISMYFGRSTNVENEFMEGDPFTISFTMRSPSSEDDTLPTVYLKSGMGYYQLKGKLTADWSTVWYSGVWKDANSISFHLGFSKCIGTYEFLNCKLEKGTRATDWTPAPEDVETRIVSAESSFTQRADSIEGRVGGVEGRVSVVEQKADGLTVSLQDLEIGGRNLLKNGTFAKNADQWTHNASNPFVYLSNGGYRGDGALQITVTASNVVVPRQSIIRTFAAGSVLTCSVKVKEVEGSWNTSAYARFANLYSLPYLNHRELENGWTLYVYQSKLTSDLSPTSANLFGFANVNKGSYIIDDIKLELGTKATDWTPAPEDVDSDVTNAAKTATNYMSFSSSGLVVGDMTASTLGNNVLIDSDSVDIRNGSTTLASYQANKIELAKNSPSAVIDMCSGTAQFTNKNDASGIDWYRLGISSRDSIGLDTGGEITMDTHYDNVSGDYADGIFRMSSCQPWNMELFGFEEAYAHWVIKNKVSGVEKAAKIELYPQLGVNLVHTNKAGTAGVYIYGGGGSGDAWSTNNRIDIEADVVNTPTSSVKFTKNNAKIYGVDPDGVTKAVFIPQNQYGNTIIGIDNYSTGKGNTNIYGQDINIAASEAGNVSYRPYYRGNGLTTEGDSITMKVRTAGFVTNSGQTVQFTVPLAKPIIGNPTITASSVDGFQFRGNGFYTHGSSAEAYAKPDSYSVVTTNGGNNVVVSATFSNTTNVANNTNSTGFRNNSPIGIYWSGKLTITFG